MAYSGTQNIIDILGGANKISVGTSGTADISAATIELFISKADAYIDYKLMPIYGTNGFGTSSLGTRGVPSIVKSISEDIAAYYVISSLSTPLKIEENDFAKQLWDRANGILGTLATGNITLPGYSVDENNLPASNIMTFDVFDEIVTMTGTDVIDLSYAKVVAGSERVHGTTIDGTRVYTKGEAYQIYYWNDKTSGLNYGKIRRLATGGATGTITDGQDISIDYKVWNANVFSSPDKEVWGDPQARAYDREEPNKWRFGNG